MQSYCCKTLIRAQNTPVISEVNFMYYLSQLKVLVTDVCKPENPVLTIHKSGLLDSTGCEFPPPFLETKEDPYFETYWSLSF
jgi:hypothetical protein